MAQVQSYSGQAAAASNCRCDVNVSGGIDVLDLIVTRNLKEATSPSISCALPPAPLGWAYSWDAENRLTQVVTRRDPAGTFYLGDTKVEFTYDYMSRRVRKTYSRWYNDPQDGGWDWHEQSDQLFVYDRWNVVEVLDANASNAVLSQYTWGLDMSGQAGTPGTAGIHGAGGISGLLASVETGTTGSPVHWYFYDANGNVGQVLDATDTNNITTVAEYEYDPYGNTLTATGTYAAANPFRFSTKWFDTETGLSYYGYRYYNARLGRWMSRDPIGERGGLDLYGFIGNSSTNQVDLLGMNYVRPPAYIEEMMKPPSFEEGCPFPPDPGLPVSLTPASLLSFSAFGPWVTWFTAAEQGDYYVDPSVGFGKRVRELLTTRVLMQDADDDVYRQLVVGKKCNCTLSSGDTQLHPFSTERIDRTTWDYDNTPAFLSIGGLHINAWANCNVKNCCDMCKASCTIVYDVWDHDEWDVSPFYYGLNEYRWHVLFAAHKKYYLRCAN